MTEEERTFWEGYDAISAVVNDLRQAGSTVLASEIEAGQFKILSGFDALVPQGETKTH